MLQYRKILSNFGFSFQLTPQKLFSSPIKIQIVFNRHDKIIPTNVSNRPNCAPFDDRFDDDTDQLLSETHETVCLSNYRKQWNSPLTDKYLKLTFSYDVRNLHND